MVHNQKPTLFDTIVVKLSPCRSRSYVQVTYAMVKSRNSVPSYELAEVLIKTDTKSESVELHSKFKVPTVKVCPDPRDTGHCLFAFEHITRKWLSINWSRNRKDTPILYLPGKKHKFSFQVTSVTHPDVTPSKLVLTFRRP